MSVSDISEVSGQSLAYSAITQEGVEAYVERLATPVGCGSAAAKAISAAATPPPSCSASVPLHLNVGLEQMPWLKYLFNWGCRYFASLGLVWCL